MASVNPTGVAHETARKFTFDVVWVFVASAM